MNPRTMTAAERRVVGLSLQPTMHGIRQVPSAAERLLVWQAALTSRSDYDHGDRARRMARGVAWIDAYWRRPIPRHRALAVIEQDPPIDLAGEAAAAAEFVTANYAAIRG